MIFFGRSWCKGLAKWPSSCGIIDASVNKTFAFGATLLDINCGVVLRVTAGRETWVVEATGGCFEVAKKKTNSRSMKTDYRGRRETVGGGKV
jgi:hypothetical protein